MKLLKMFRAPSKYVEISLIRFRPIKPFNIDIRETFEHLGQAAPNFEAFVQYERECASKNVESTREGFDAWVSARLRHDLVV